MRNIALMLCFLLAACAPKPLQGSPNNSLYPYTTATTSITDTPNIILPVTAQPSPTPYIYKIEAGDTFSGLSEKFHISQDDLRAANPNVQPNSMVIGTTLLIPDSSAASSEGSTPTPAAVPITQTDCYPTADNGQWCFALIQNNTADILENVSAQITLLDGNNNPLASQSAFTPLDIIPPNSSMPVYAYFPNVQANINIQVQLLSAVQNAGNASHYLSAVLKNTITKISWNGLTAQISGQIILPAESKPATQVWVAAIAYNKDGQVVGLKRWEGGAVQPGVNMPFSFSVSSVGPGIDSVEFGVEAKP
jgi:LysM repeat protein